MKATDSGRYGVQRAGNAITRCVHDCVRFDQPKHVTTSQNITVCRQDTQTVRLNHWPNEQRQTEAVFTNCKE
jgi:hypothetical protein